MKPTRLAPLLLSLVSLVAGCAASSDDDVDTATGANSTGPTLKTYEEALLGAFVTKDFVFEKRLELGSFDLQKARFWSTSEWVSFATPFSFGGKTYPSARCEISILEELPFTRLAPQTIEPEYYFVRSVYFKDERFSPTKPPKFNFWLMNKDKERKFENPTDFKTECELTTDDLSARSSLFVR